MSTIEHDNKEDHTQLIVCGVPEDLKMQFKLSCVRRGLSMSEVLIEAIRKIVEQYDFER